MEGTVPTIIEYGPFKQTHRAQNMMNADLIYPDYIPVTLKMYT